MRKFHVGIDIDNTIIDYDSVFGPAGEELGMLPPGHGLQSKADVKSYIMTGPGGDEAWMRLQGQVYGRFISRAQLFDGVAAFLIMARSAGVRVSLVSHKTRYGHFDADRVDLRGAALGWLTEHGFFALDRFCLSSSDVHFTETRDEKIAIIAQIGCDVFIDDLVEVLVHDQFPRPVHKIWFAGTVGDACEFPAHRDWNQIAVTVSGLLNGPLG